MPEGVTITAGAPVPAGRRPTTWAELQALRTIRLDAPCPVAECDEGWIDDGRCAGHLCGWPGHYPTLDDRLDELLDDLRERVAGLVAATFDEAAA